MCAPLRIVDLLPGAIARPAKATDVFCMSTSSTAITVTAIANQPSAVSLTSPAANTVSPAPGNFTLTANATSTGSTIARVDFYNGTILLGTATAAPYSFTWSNVPPGTYSITAKATDSLNVATSSSPVSVTVNAASVQAYYIHADQLDTPRTITDTGGVVVWQWDNVDPFGNNMANENPTGAGAFSFNLRFPGQYFDRETNTHYNINRDYDAAIGRYLQSDPIGLAGGINGYVYVLNNPLRYIDPLGLDVTITISNRAYSSTGNSVGGTITATSDQTSATFSGYTMENAHAGDNGNKNPIPAGTYKASVREDHTPNRVEFQGVDGYDNIQIHNGSYPRNFKGCFGAGKSRSTDFLGGTVPAMDQINNIVRTDGTGKITVIVGPIQ